MTPTAKTEPTHDKHRPLRKYEVAAWLYNHGCTYTEIAVMLECKENTVGYHICQARKKRLITGSIRPKRYPVY